MKILTVVPHKIINIFLFVARQKKSLKNFGSKTWWTKKPAGYRFAQHGYRLTSCPGQPIPAALFYCLLYYK